MISQNEVEMDTSKVRAVTDWPEPVTIKELQQFLRFRRALPLQQKSFTILQHPDPNRPFIVEVDLPLCLLF